MNRRLLPHLFIWGILAKFPEKVSAHRKVLKSCLKKPSTLHSCTFLILLITDWKAHLYEEYTFITLYWKTATFICVQISQPEATLFQTYTASKTLIRLASTQPAENTTNFTSNLTYQLPHELGQQNLNVLLVFLTIIETLLKVTQKIIKILSFLWKHFFPVACFATLESYYWTINY